MTTERIRKHFKNRGFKVIACMTTPISYRVEKENGRGFYQYTKYYSLSAAHKAIFGY